MTLSSEERRKINRGCSHRGKKGQRDLFRFLCGIWGLGTGRDSGTYTQDHPDCRFRIGPAVGDHIEGKAWAKWRPRQWIRQAERDCDGKPWIVGFKRPGPRWRRFRETWYVLTPKRCLDQILFDRVTEPNETRWPMSVERALESAWFLDTTYAGLYMHSRVHDLTRWDLEPWIMEVEAMCRAGKIPWVLFLWRPTDMLVTPDTESGYVEIVDGKAVPMNVTTFVYREPIYAVLPAATWARLKLEAWEKTRDEEGGPECASTVTRPSS